LPEIFPELKLFWLPENFLLPEIFSRAKNFFGCQKTFLVDRKISTGVIS
jgi:hypothetical protein